MTTMRLEGEGNKMNGMSKSEIGVGVGLVSFLAGVLIGAVGDSFLTHKIYDIKVFQRGEKPAVMRLYKPGMDEILVENPEGKGEFIINWEYVNRLGNESDRKMEDAEIKKIVGWYEE